MSERIDAPNTITQIDDRNPCFDKTLDCELFDSGAVVDNNSVATDLYSDGVANNNSVATDLYSDSVPKDMISAATDLYCDGVAKDMLSSATDLCQSEEDILNLCCRPALPQKKVG